MATLALSASSRPDGDDDDSELSSDDGSICPVCDVDCTCDQRINRRRRDSLVAPPVEVFGPTPTLQRNNSKRVLPPPPAAAAPPLPAPTNGVRRTATPLANAAAVVDELANGLSATMGPPLNMPSSASYAGLPPRAAPPTLATATTSAAPASIALAQQGTGAATASSPLELASAGVLPATVRSHASLHSNSSNSNSARRGRKASRTSSSPTATPTTDVGGSGLFGGADMDGSASLPGSPPSHFDDKTGDNPLGGDEVASGATTPNGGRSGRLVGRSPRKASNAGTASLDSSPRKRDDRIINCHFIGCDKTYTTMAGLRYHMRTFDHSNMVLSPSYLASTAAAAAATTATSGGSANDEGGAAAVIVRNGRTSKGAGASAAGIKAEGADPAPNANGGAADEGDGEHDLRTTRRAGLRATVPSVAPGEYMTGHLGGTIAGNANGAGDRTNRAVPNVGAPAGPTTARLGRRPSDVRSRRSSGMDVDPDDEPVRRSSTPVNGGTTKPAGAAGHTSAASRSRPPKEAPGTANGNVAVAVSFRLRPAGNVAPPKAGKKRIESDDEDDDNEDGDVVDDDEDDDDSNDTGSDGDDDAGSDSATSSGASVASGGWAIEEVGILHAPIDFRNVADMDEDEDASRRARVALDDDDDSETEISFFHPQRFALHVTGSKRKRVDWRASGLVDALAGGGDTAAAAAVAAANGEVGEDADDDDDDEDANAERGLEDEFDEFVFEYANPVRTIMTAEFMANKLDLLPEHARMPTMTRSGGSAGGGRRASISRSAASDQSFASLVGELVGATPSSPVAFPSPMFGPLMPSPVMSHLALEIYTEDKLSAFSLDASRVEADWNV